MAALGERADDLGGGADDAQHAAVGVELRQIVLLNGAQSLRRCGVAPQDDEVTPHLEQLDDSLSRELIDHLKRARSVGSTGIVAQIHVIVLGQQLTDAVQNGQSAVAAIEDSNGSWGFA